MRKMASGKLINQVRTKVRNMASFNFPTPLIQLTVIHRPKLTTKLKILQNRISLAFLKQVFGQTHIWTKTVHLWRTRTFSSFKQIFFASSICPSEPQCAQAQDCRLE